jgi:hypothetical protein
MKVYVKKNEQVYEMPVNAFVTVAKDGARGTGYALPEECIVNAANGPVLNVDSWSAVDFQKWLADWEQFRNDPAPVVEMVKVEEPAPVVEERSPVVEPVMEVKKAIARKRTKK